MSATREGVTVDTPHYAARLRNTAPMGIASLRMAGQTTDFAHADLTLADWEWVWFDAVGQPLERIKLLDTDWGTPEVRAREDVVDIVYRLPLSDAGVSARITYRFPVAGPSFRVTYVLRNDSQAMLQTPYIMLGFPGFSNHDHVREVADMRSTRVPEPPHAFFRPEAQERQLVEYPLLRHDVPRGRVEGLKGSIVIREKAGDYRLTTYFLADARLPRVFSAHTNKPRYLTSHLYVTLRDLPAGVARSLTVYYVMAHEQVAHEQVAGEKVARE